MSNTLAAETAVHEKTQPRYKIPWVPFFIALAAIGALHYLIWELLSDAYPVGHAFRLTLGLYLTSSCIAIPAGFASLRTSNQRLGVALSWVGMLALGLFSSLFVLTVLRSLALLVLLIFGLQIVNIEPITGLAVVTLAVLATFAGLLVARASPAVVNVKIHLENLPQSLEGFRIAQITDIHVGPTIRTKYMQRIVDKVNALKADLVAITGDVVDGDVATLRSHVAPLHGLLAVEGVALVIGNHELYSGVHAWVEEFRRLGLKVLLNEHFVVQRGEASIAIAGVTDHTTARFFPEMACDPHAAISGAGQVANVKVLVAHQPVTAAAASKAGFDLSLHGHTHGGQWWPWNYFVRMQQPVVRGLHRFGNMWSYTSVGTGYWGPPKRHFRSEITLLTLHTKV